MMRPRERRKRKGSSMLEFALVAPFLVTTLAGSFTIGMSMNRALQARQVVRNANVLMVRGYDLSIAENQTLIVRTAQGLGMNVTGTNTPDANGRAVVILSRILKVGAVTCNQGIANWNQSPASCPNFGQYVIETRVVIGNQTRWTSFTGPNGTGRDAMGWITKNQAATNNAYRTTGNFASALTLNDDEYSYVGEIFVDSSDINLLPVLGANQSIYARNFS